MQTIIFDMYGVILKDPDGGLMPFVNRFFPDLNFDDVSIYWRKANVGEISSLEFFSKLGFEGDIKKIEKEYLDTIEVDASFYSAAQTLGKYYRLAVLSNDLSEWSNYLRGKFDINKYFDTIVISGDVKLQKPDINIFNLMIDRLALPACNCVYIDDRRRNLSAAKSTGMETILFNSRNVEYDGRIVFNFDELVDALIHNKN
ncbi:MAG: HAD-IA family hydrolase [Treponema sp.]|jgi:putative hydrolase of the HAD superfamily|nr:HAD-IA family hydrolase [Treponema sp.]